MLPSTPLDRNPAAATGTSTGRQVKLPGRVIAFVVVALCTAFSIYVGRVDVALQPGSPPHSDLGGHIVALKHFIETSLPRGHLTDWSHQWFAGYPSFYFYFPLPALLIAALTLLMPLELAAKLTAIFAPAALPAVSYAFVRALGYARLHAICAAVAMVAYLTMTHQYIFGGNVLSSVIGEYSFAIGLALAVLYLAYVARALRGERRTAALSIILAATALSHTITTIFAVLGSLAALRDRTARRQVISSWILGFALSAFWTVPFLLRAPFMGKIEWTYVMKPWLLFPLPVLLILPIVLASFWSLRPYRRELLVLGAFAITAALAYLVPHTFFAPARAWPVWHLGVFIWCGLGIGAGLLRAWERQSRLPLTLWSAALVLLIGLGIVQMDLVRKRAGELLDSGAKDTEQFASLLVTLRTLPPGMLHWEQLQGDEQILGGHLALGSVPARAPRLRTGVGLLRESGLLSPVSSYIRSNVTWDTINTGVWRLITPNDTDPARMKHRLREFGINYFVAVTERGADWARADTSQFELIASGAPWTLFRVRHAQLVEPLRRAPHIMRGRDWNDAVIDWIRSVSDTMTWQLYEPARDVAFATPPAFADSVVRNARLGYNSVRFTTTAVGVPHLVRVAYFPNWRVYGAEGPYLTVPGFMMVVPTAGEVQLRFERTAVDQVGRALTLVALLVLLLFWRRDRRAA